MRILRNVYLGFCGHPGPQIRRDHQRRGKDQRKQEEEGKGASQEILDPAPSYDDAHQIIPAYS